MQVYVHTLGIIPSRILPTVPSLIPRSLAVLICTSDKFVT